MSDAIQEYYGQRCDRLLEKREAYAEAQRIRQLRRKAGLASAARMTTERLELLRRIAVLGGRARAKTITPLERHRLAVIGGRASIASRDPAELALMRHRGGEAAKLSITHEQRVAMGRLGAKIKLEKFRGTPPTSY